MAGEMKGGQSEELADPDFRVHAAWITHVSAASDTSSNGQAPEQHVAKQDGSVEVATSSSSPSEFVGEHDVPNSQRSCLGRRPAGVRVGLIGLTFALAMAAAGIISHHLEFLRSSPEPSDQTREMVSSDGLSTGRLGSPKLMVQSSPAVSGEPAPLGLTLWGAANGAVVLLRGLPPGMELSAGSAVSDGLWQLSAADLPDAWIAPPDGFVGSAHLVAELQLPNSRIIDRRSVRLEWTRRGHEIGAVTNAPATLQHPNDPALSPATPEISDQPSQAGSRHRLEETKGARQRGKNNSPPHERLPPSMSLSVGDGARPAEPEITNSTCFASASEVKQHHPKAWPSWTLRALGHEGTKCWYPTNRTLAHDHPQ